MFEAVEAVIKLRKATKLRKVAKLRKK